MKKRNLMTGILVAVVAGMIPMGSQAAGTCDETCWANVIPPIQATKMRNWLNKKTYTETFQAEPEVHPSPIHGNVLTYYNPVLVNDLLKGRTVFSKGAAMVKELYEGDTVTGYAVMVKTVKRKGATQDKDWTYYENFTTNSQPAFYGKGGARNVAICVDCHKKGTDFLLSDFRP